MAMEEKHKAPQINGKLRQVALRVPEAIRKCSGIVIFGKRIKSLVFTTDVSIMRNVNADAVIAVYPFTPQPVITDALLTAADLPLFVGVGGGLTKGERVTSLAIFAEMQGAIGVVVNAPTSNESIASISRAVEIPLVVTVVSEDTDFAGRIAAGAAIFNVSCAGDTPRVVRKIREQYPDFPIIATGGPTEESILETVAAGANAITWTPPSCAEIFRDVMTAYREHREHP